MDTAYKLFNTPWLVQIPELYCYSDFELTEIGVHSTGNKAEDADMMHGKRDLYCTIVAMLSYYDNGAPIQFKALQDVKKIYAIILEHLDAWLYIMQTQIGVEAPPVDDFIRLDEFARTLFPLTQHTEGEPVYIGLKARLSAFSSGSKGLGGRMGRVSQANLLGTPTAANTPAHKSCIDSLIDLLVREDYYEH